MSVTIAFQNRDVLDFADVSRNTKIDWLKAVKQESLSAFKQAKMPNRKIEHWKYNDLAFLNNNEFTIGPIADEQHKLKTAYQQATQDAEKLNLENAIELVFVDGILITQIEHELNEAGLSITLFNNANDEQQSIITQQLKADINSKNLLLNLNQSLVNDGLLIEIKANHQVKRPVHIKYYTAQQASHLSTHKVIVNVGSSSEFTFVEEFVDAKTEQLETQSSSLSLQQTTINQAENSQFNHYRLNLQNEGIYHCGQVKNILNKNSVLNSFYLGFGSKLNRTDLDILHKGENAECNITGIYLPAGERAIDYHTNVEHQVPHCNTNEVFRGIIADQASATFNGRIHIFQDAQKSDAYLNNKNLLLTNQAEVNTKPELEIYADDVVCAHGATVAQLDEKSMYYLQTRGIGRSKAKKMLSIAFIQELINSVKQSKIQEFLKLLLDSHMSKID